MANTVLSALLKKLKIRSLTDAVIWNLVSKTMSSA